VLEFLLLRVPLSAMMAEQMSLELLQHVRFEISGPTWCPDASRALVLNNADSSLLVELFIGQFPVWYHLTFLLTIIPAVLVGALLPERRNKDLNEVYSAPR